MEGLVAYGDAVERVPTGHWRSATEFTWNGVNGNEDEDSDRTLWIDLSAILLARTLAAQAAAPFVSNVRAAQRPGAKLVDTYYEVADADGDKLTITVAVSDTGGATYAVPATTFTGDVGANFSSGTGKQIVWNAGLDWPNRFSANMRFRVTATDLDGTGVAHRQRDGGPHAASLRTDSDGGLLTVWTRNPSSAHGNKCGGRRRSALGALRMPGQKAGARRKPCWPSSKTASHRPWRARASARSMPGQQMRTAR